MSNTGIPDSSSSMFQPGVGRGRKPAGIYYYSRKKKRIKQALTALISLFLLLGLCFLGFLYAPFEPFVMLRDLWVTTAMTTMHHQYLATALFSQDEIDQIMAKERAADLGNSDPNAIQTPAGGTSADQGIEKFW